MDTRFVRTDLFRGDILFVQKIKGDRDEFSIEIPSRVYAVAIGPKIAMSFGQGLQSVFFQNGSDAGRILAAHLEDAQHEFDR